MIDEREIVRRAAEALTPPEPSFDRLLQRRDRVQRNRRIRAGVLGIAVAIAVGWVGFEAIRSTPPVPADDPTPTEDLGIFAPVAGRIVYGGGDAGDLWAIDPSVADDAASTRVRLPQDALPPDLWTTPLGWSSDGTELLFKRGYGEDCCFPEEYLYILHADGSETQLNSEPIYFAERSATISPDGTRVVFAAQSDPSGLYVIDAEGGRPVPLPIPQAGDFVNAPTFSPDGTKIAYLAGNGEAQVWVMNADGTDAHEILADEPTVFGGNTGLQWSPAGDRLAIGLGDGQGSDGLVIYTFAPDGSDFTKVITGGASPYWSPDGSQIAYTIPCEERPTDSCPEGSILRSQYEAQPGLFGGGSAGLAIADADGSNVREFGFAASGPWHPAASIGPDEPAPTPSDSFARANGEVLRFTGVLNEVSGDLVAVNPQTGAERVLVEGLDNVYSASWSADGHWVAYSTVAADSDRRDLWVADAGHEPRQVGTGESVLVWSSTGAEIGRVQLSSSLHTNIAGSTLSTIDPVTGKSTYVGAIPDGVGDVGSPAWSPDLTRFVFGARGGAIHSVDVGSGSSSLLVSLPGENLDSVDQIVWSPDGAHIAVVNDGDPGGVYVMNADGSNVILRDDFGDYSGTGIAWSPDGTRLAYQDGSGVIWAAPIDGSAPTEIGTPLLGSGGDVLLSDDDLTWSPDGSRIALRHIGYSAGSDPSVDVSALDADGRGEAERIDELTFLSWAGGSYDCGCV